MFNQSISVYHSFYLESFRPIADLPIFSHQEQPRQFIYSLGAVTDYKVWSYGHLVVWFQVYVGWGVMEYNSDAHQFKSMVSHYFTTEPTVNAEYQLGNLTFIGLGVGYRSLWGMSDIEYTSDIINGTIPIARHFPNGIVLLLTVKGYW